MSSPTVIIGSPAPRLIARAANRDAVDSYLASAKEVYEAMIRVNLEITASGGVPVRLDVTSYADAEVRANSLYESTSDGFTASTYAHAYWRSLKHPWYDQVLKRFGGVEAEQQQLRTKESAKLDALADEILARVNGERSTDRFVGGAESTGPAFSWDHALDESVRSIISHTPPDQQQGVSETIMRMASKPSRERFIAFEAFRLSVEQQDKEAFEQEALRNYYIKQAELARQAIKVKIARCEAIADEVGSPEADMLADQMKSLGESLGAIDVAVIEEGLETLERSLLKEKSRQGLLQATVQALRRQGYEQVEVMATLRPQDVASIYMLDPQDDKRLTLLQVDEEQGLVAATVVAREQTPASQLGRQLDVAAQKRLCKAMDVAERVLSQRWNCEVDRTPPGDHVEVDRRLADCKVKSLSRVAPPKHQQRSVG